jgi:hypothetical protein
MHTMNLLPIRLLALAGILAFGAHASAQSFNLDAGDQSGAFGLPSSSHGAAAAQSGTWVNIGFAPGTTAPLADITGAATPVTVSHSGGSAFSANFLGLTGEPVKLLCDIVDTGNSTVYTFNNLASGAYAVYTYSWAPDDITFRTLVTPGPGALEPAVTVGGAWPGSYTAGVTHALHHFPNVTGGTLSITLAMQTGAGTLNGFQLVRTAPAPGATTFCFGDGSGTACPCGNNGAPGNGCAHSLSAAGAHLAGVGSASVANDSFVLQGTNMPNSFALYFQAVGNVAGGLGATFGDGLRCANGSVVRLATKSNAGGASSYPSAGDPSIHVKGAVAAGNLRRYQCWYRNAAAFCSPDTFNLTNGVEATWVP